MNLVKNIVWSPKAYAKAAVLAREAGAEMLSRLDWMILQPRIIVDVGCGTGEMSKELQARYQNAQVVAIDLSQAMIEHAKEDMLACVCADGARLPLPDETVDLITANFLLPWHHDFTLLLREWRRVLRPEGLVMFTALGPDTLKAWQAVWSSDDIPCLVDLHEIGDELIRQGFTDPVLDINHYELTYRKKDTLLDELHQSGMLATQSQWVDLPETNDDGVWTAAFEVVQVHAFAPGVTATAAADGTVRVPIAHLRRR